MKKTALTLISILAIATCLSAKAPVIGISAYSDDAKNKANNTYIRAVRYAGGAPVIIPVTTDDGQIDAVIEAIDGLIMTGGADFDPLKWYGEQPVRQLGEVTPERDEFDVKLIRAAVAKGIPVLGICRGEQLEAVAFGGSLWQDIPSQVPDSYIKHRQSPTPGTYPTHTIDIAKGSFLEKALNSTEASVNTFHHQAIKKCPAGFKVVATSPDGIVEAVERTGKLDPKYSDGGNIIIGCQFHPEILSTDKNSPFVGIFRVLVEKASEK